MTSTDAMLRDQFVALVSQLSEVVCDVEEQVGVLQAAPGVGAGLASDLVSFALLLNTSLDKLTVTVLDRWPSLADGHPSFGGGCDD